MIYLCKGAGLVCIEFPGLVNDHEKAIKTLGGLKNIGNYQYLTTIIMSLSSAALKKSKYYVS